MIESYCEQAQPEDIQNRPAVFLSFSIKNIVAVHLTTEQRHTSLMSYAGKSGARVLHACFTVFQDGIRGLCEVP